MTRAERKERERVLLDLWLPALAGSDHVRAMMIAVAMGTPAFADYLDGTDSELDARASLHGALP